MAVSIVSVIVVALGQLIILVDRTARTAEGVTLASMLAAAKMEALLAADLLPSPPGTLTAAAPGYCDFFDPLGRPVDGAAASFAGEAYVRRWSIEPLPADAEDTLVLQVSVTSPSGRGFTEARLVALKTRRVTR